MGKTEKRNVWGKSDIFINTCYISHSKGSEKNNNSVETLFDEIANFKEKGRVLIKGDLNARTGTQPDYIEPDKFDMDMGITSETTPHYVIQKIGILYL